MRIRGDAFPGDPYRLDETACVEPQLVDADDAMIAICLAEWAAMIDDVPVRRSIDVQDGVMSRAGGDRGILLKNPAHSIERPKR